MYPYTKEGIQQCLKEKCNTEAEVIAESFSFVEAKAIPNGKIEGVYEFKTEDGTSYQIVFEGEGTENDLRHKILFKWNIIKSISKK